MSEKGLFKGFSTIELLTLDPRVMCAILSENLVKANLVIMTQAEEIKQLKEAKEVKENKE